MKKVALSLVVLGSILFSSCEKDNTLVPEKELIKADKGILCRGCGSWDKDNPNPNPTPEPNPTPSGSRIASPTESDASSDTTTTTKPGKNKK